ncbi:MAG TPA: MGMT family protein [Candidatus Woesebacteria bacterium]|jgi:methylated-DNA-[protein]-cysteine S-methyltransferase|nr:MGMT family protein [Candidatus Woesebacteria bacterium]
MTTNFQKKVYKIVSKIPKGQTMSYKQVASIMGTKAYQAVGQALKNNPDPTNIPCHRVIKSNGQVGSYFGKNDSSSKRKKLKILRSEGVKI